MSKEGIGSGELNYLVQPHTHTHVCVTYERHQVKVDNKRIFSFQFFLGCFGPLHLRGILGVGLPPFPLPLSDTHTHTATPSRPTRLEQTTGVNTNVKPAKQEAFYKGLSKC